MGGKDPSDIKRSDLLNTMETENTATATREVEGIAREKAEAGLVPGNEGTNCPGFKLLLMIYKTQLGLPECVN